MLFCANLYDDGFPNVCGTKLVQRRPILTYLPHTNWQGPINHAGYKTISIFSYAREYDKIIYLLTANLKSIECRGSRT